MPPLRDRTGEKRENNFQGKLTNKHPTNSRHKREAGDGVETEASPAPVVKDDRQVTLRYQTFVLLSLKAQDPVKIY